MIRHRVVGAVRYPAFLILWTAGVVAVTAQFQAVDASPVPAFERAAEGADPFPAAILDPTPDLHDPDAWRETIAAMVRDTEVASGAWQPRRAEPVPAIAPVLAVVPAERATAAGAMQRSADGADVAGAPGRRTTVAETPTWKTPAAVGTPDARSVDQPGIDPADTLRREKAAARSALLAGRYGEAYALLRPVVADAGQDVEFLGLLALAAVHIGSDGEALVLYRHLTALEPERGRWRVGLALARQRLAIDPDDPDAQALAAVDGAADVDADGGDLG